MNTAYMIHLYGNTFIVLIPSVSVIDIIEMDSGFTEIYHTMQKTLIPVSQEVMEAWEEEFGQSEYAGHLYAVSMECDVSFVGKQKANVDQYIMQDIVDHMNLPRKAYWN